MSENTITFIQDSHGIRLEMVMSSRSTWMELCDDYLKFLKGCGYHVNARDLADHFNQMAGE